MESYKINKLIGETEINYLNAQDEEFLFSKIAENPFYILALNSPTERLVEFALAQNANLIQFIEQTYDRCLYAIKSNSSSIKYIEKRFMKKELVDEALNDNLSNILYLPIELLTKDMILKSMFNKPYLKKDDFISFFGKDFYANIM